MKMGRWDEKRGKKEKGGDTAERKEKEKKEIPLLLEEERPGK